MANLFEIKQEYLDILNNLEVDENGEIVSLEELIAKEDELNDKIKNVALYIRNEEMLNDDIAKIIKAYTERKEIKKKKIERLKTYLLANLEDIGKKDFECPECKVSTRKSESVEITDETLLDKGYIKEKVTYSPDKIAIKAALKDGIIVPGATLVEKKNISIK